MPFKSALSVVVRSLLCRKMLRRQTNRLQVRAKELTRDGKSDRVTAELSEGVELLMALLDLLPGDEGMDLELGFLFGAYGWLLLPSDVLRNHTKTKL
jgi:hypothetical protein